MKATPITKKENDKLLGPMTVMHLTAGLLKHNGYSPGHVHSIHSIDFDNPSIFNIPDGTQEIEECPCYMITILRNSNEIRLAYIIHSEGVLSICYIDKDHHEISPDYQTNTQKFLVLPDLGQLISFLRSIPLANY